MKRLCEKLTGVMFTFNINDNSYGMLVDAYDSTHIRHTIFNTVYDKDINQYLYDKRHTATALVPIVDGFDGRTYTPSDELMQSLLKKLKIQTL